MWRTVCVTCAHALLSTTVSCNLYMEGGKRDVAVSACITPVFRHHDPYILGRYWFKIFLSNLLWFIFAKMQYITLQVKYR